MEVKKAHSAAKLVLPRGENLSKTILETTRLISKVVGDTLGPGGHPVLIERPEVDLAPIVTKDGVTVFKALGFENSIQQNILESCRDASVKTAMEAGDGTTTATILMEAFTRLTHEYCERNPSIPPIKVIKRIHDIYNNKLLKIIEDNKITCKYDKKGKKLLRSVARLSANGDEELADAVMEAFDICGDEGNVTIIDNSGPSGYEVEQIVGYPIAMGYEESCAKYYPLFLNDPVGQKIVADKPMFLLYFGRITDIQTLVPLMETLTDLFHAKGLVSHNLVIVALGFSEAVLQTLGLWTSHPTQLNVYPLVIPSSPIINGQRSILDDIAAVTGATVFDQLSKPLETFKLDPNTGESDLGNIEPNEDMVWGPSTEEGMGVTTFECGRYRSTIVGFCDPEVVLARQEEVKAQAEASESVLEANMIKERAAKLTGSIAKLKVIGSSNGELKERRDRAEDAVCAVRGAIKDGALIGGGWCLAKMIDSLDSDDPIEDEIVKPALWEPIMTLYNNAGLPCTEEDGIAFLTESYKSVKTKKLADVVVRDVSTGEMVNALDCGILDSLPAVKEALKNAISIASLLGTLGGCIVQARDREIDTIETKSYGEFMKSMHDNFNPADERAM